MVFVAHSSQCINKPTGGQADSLLYRGHMRQNNLWHMGPNFANNGRDLCGSRRGVGESGSGN